MSSMAKPSISTRIALCRFERVGAGRDLPVDPAIVVVAARLRIERREDRGGIEIVDDDVRQLACQLVRLAWLLHLDRDDGAVGLHRIDLAVLEVLDRQPGIGELAAAGGSAAGIETHRQCRGRKRRGRDARVLAEHVAVHLDQGAVRWRSCGVNGAGIVAHRQLRDLVGRLSVLPGRPGPVRPQRR